MFRGGVLWMVLVTLEHKYSQFGTIKQLKIPIYKGMTITIHGHVQNKVTNNWLYYD